MSGSEIDDDLDDLIRRVMQATYPMRGKEILPMKLTLAELRQAAERTWSYKIRWGLRRLFGLGSHYQPPRKKANQEGGRHEPTSDA